MMAWTQLIQRPYTLTLWCLKLGLEYDSISVCDTWTLCFVPSADLDAVQAAKTVAAGLANKLLRMEELTDMIDAHTMTLPETLEKNSVRSDLLVAILDEYITLIASGAPSATSAFRQGRYRIPPAEPIALTCTCAGDFQDAMKKRVEQLTAACQGEGKVTAFLDPKQVSSHWLACRLSHPDLRDHHTRDLLHSCSSLYGKLCCDVSVPYCPLVALASDQNTVVYTRP